MRKINLTKGMVALVDDVDFEWLNQWKWCMQSSGYACRFDYSEGSNPGKMILMHRLLLKPSEGLVVDHINRDKLDNRRDNLRIVSHSQNHLNSGLFKHNTSGYKGVTWDKERGKWKAQIKWNGKNKNLGLFLLPEHASAAYQEAKSAKI